MTAPAPEQGLGVLLRRFWGFTGPQRRWLWLGLGMIPLVAATTTVRPLLVKHAVDVDLPAANHAGLRWTALMFLAVVIASFLVQAVEVYALQRAGHYVLSDIRRAVFRHVLHLPSRYFDRHALGSLLTRTTSDVEALGETLSFGVFMIVTDAVMLISILVAMFLLSPTLTLITLTLAPLLIVLVRTFGGHLRRLQLQVRTSQAAQNGHLAEQLAGVTVVQLFGRQDHAISRYRELGESYLSATKRANIFDALLYSIMDGVSAFAIALLLFFATAHISHDTVGPITLGLLFAFVDYVQRIFVPIKEFSGKLATIQRAAASLERIYGLLDEPSETAPVPSSDPLHGWKGALRVQHLRFRYHPKGPEILRDISFEIAPGEIVAVVGRTGSGKSSLARVLTRLYGGYQGSIKLDVAGTDIELDTIPPRILRKNLLMVQQDVFLFNEDIAYNVALGEPDLLQDTERLRAALRVVQAEPLVEERGGLSFAVGERGSNLSAGEAQLVAFARVAAREPGLLILDEATASVDSLTERKVQAAIERLFDERSVLVIAHRLSTVRRADKIIVLDRGQIVEMGRHEDLLAANGLYAELYRTGFSETSGQGS